MDENKTEESVEDLAPIDKSAPYDASKPLSQIIEDNTMYVIKHGDILDNYGDVDVKHSIALTCQLINYEINLHNNHISEGDVKLGKIKELPILSIAILIAFRPDVALVAPGDKSQANRERTLSMEERMKLPIGFYSDYGDNKGIWELTNSYEGAFGALVEKYKPTATLREKKEVFALAKSRMFVVYKCTIPYYVPVQNGIMDVLNKTLLPFTARLVFTTKIRTEYNPCAVNPHILNSEDGSWWDVDSWLASLGDPEFVMAIKEVIQAACLPLAPRDKMCLFYSETGNNGKGTICQLIRNLLGEESTVNIPLKEFSSRFGLSGLPNAIAVITDENDVGSFNQGLANLKAVITGDKVTIERKYQNSFDYAFNGLILQCINGLPKGDDKTNSFLRRLHIIPFQNCFTGKQKRYIKDKLIHRQDVLEYILKMVLVDMPYRDAFTDFKFTQDALKDFQSSTNSVNAFLDEILPNCVWDLVPATDYLFNLYRLWYKDYSPSGKVIGRNDFIDSVKKYVDTALKENPNFEWEWTNCTRWKGYIDFRKEDRNVKEYRLLPFYLYNGKSSYYSDDAVFTLKEKYSGLKRRVVTIQAPQGMQTS